MPARSHWPRHLQFARPWALTGCRGRSLFLPSLPFPHSRQPSAHAICPSLGIDSVPRAVGSAYENSVLGTAHPVFSSGPDVCRIQFGCGASPVSTMASYRRPLFTSDLFAASLRYGFTSWTYCSMCGRRKQRDQSKEGLDLLFQCPSTMVSICKLDKSATFQFGCSYDSYRQRDLETNGVHSMHANQSVLDWRREQRSL